LAWHLGRHPRPAIVCLHRPVFTCGHRDLANQYLRRVWLHGPLAGSPPALVLSGHHHYYDRTKSLDGITYVTSGGASHKLYAAETPDDRTAVFKAGVNHFGLVDVFADRLDVRVLDIDGREFDRFSVSRPEGGSRKSGVGELAREGR
jgi:acid phosphatase